MNQNIKLKRNLSPLNIVALALGAIIGSGCFLLPGDVFLETAGPLGTTIGLFIGTIMLCIIAYNYGYMINKYPVSGGEYAFSFKAFERNHAFICGWFLALCYISIVPFNATALGIISKQAFSGAFEIGYLYSVEGSEVFAGEVLLGLVAVIFFAYTNIKGVKMTGNLQMIITGALVGSVILLLIATLLNNQITYNNLKPVFPTNINPIKGVLSIVAITPFLFVGFDSIPQVAEEYDFSPKLVFKLMLATIFFGFFIYISVNTITAIIFPWQEFINNNPDWATGQAVQYLLGKFGMILLFTSLFAAIIAGINGFYLAASRLLYSMGKSSALPYWFGKLHPKYNTPVNAIIFVGVCSMIAPWFGRKVLGWIVDMSSFGAVIGFLHTSMASYKIGKDNNDFEKNKRLKITSILGCIFSLGFLGLLLIPGLPSSLSKQVLIILSLWVILGIVFYLTICKEYRSLSHKELENKIFNKAI
ncbi:APC family permease [Tepidibacter formicigenes]|jgi:amino acid transporter|uniref:Amino acid/polyamine/organocation transporter, APC superfamily n=1 Tax=Tepidibacter formicigenes DSM 15518 TaxID=1123349 RepID=A0A1M6NIN5_9FIRM|nr:APC family permease [Tepidibacter formicigenes]SHJ95595.1 amino acid/polyamine/organocation transporter, APC superfamily [Tepidibacter formicigenes DSM 15518]